MITPKPLTKEQREKLWNPNDTDELIEALKAAEAYWREAVKTVAERDTTNETKCPFCHRDYWNHHEEDCPWLIAQDT